MSVFSKSTQSLSGFSGYSGLGQVGDSGYSGISGHSGLSGFSGFSGISGYSGLSGISGHSGLSGISGISGVSGLGLSGFSGFSGTGGDGGGGVAPTIRPFSEVPITSGKVYSQIYIGDGGVSSHEEGLGVMPSLDGNAIWRLRFELPQVIPSGTCKLRLIALADAEAGVAKVNPSWVGVAMGEDPSSATLNAETVQTVTWTTGSDDTYIETLVTLDADAGGINGGEIIVMDLIFETSGWTLAAESVWQASIIWTA